MRSPALISPSSKEGCHAVLAFLSKRYPPLQGRSPTRYSPVCHSTYPLRGFRVRLACVRHAASVDSEPGSNSHVKVIAPRVIPTRFRAWKTPLRTNPNARASRLLRVRNITLSICGPSQANPRRPQADSRRALCCHAIRIPVSIPTRRSVLASVPKRRSVLALMPKRREAFWH